MRNKIFTFIGLIISLFIFIPNIGALSLDELKETLENEYIVFNTSYQSVIDILYSKTDLLSEFLEKIFEKKLYYAFITDDQWEKLEQMWEEYEIKEVNDRNRSNSLATLIKVAAGTVYIGGFVLGLVLGKDYRGNLSLWSILTYWIVAFVGGTSLLWFAQVLDLLHGVKKYAEMIFTKLTRK